MTIKARGPLVTIMYTKVVYKDDSNTMSYKVIHHTPGDCTWSTNTYNYNEKSENRTVGLYTARKHVCWPLHIDVHAMDTG